MDWTILFHTDFKHSSISVVLVGYLFGWFLMSVPFPEEHFFFIVCTPNSMINEGANEWLACIREGIFPLSILACLLAAACQSD